MKWYHRLYQRKDGSLTPLGRIHYGVGPARKESKKDIIRSGDAKKVAKNQSKLSNRELEEATARVKQVNEINRLRAEEKRNARKRINDAIEALGTVKKTAENVKGLINTGVETYNLVVDVKNTFTSDPSKKMPKIGNSGNPSWLNEALAKNDWSTIYKNVGSLNEKQIKDVASRAESVAKVAKAAGSSKGNSGQNKDSKQDGGNSGQNKEESGSSGGWKKEDKPSDSTGVKDDGNPGNRYFGSNYTKETPVNTYRSPSNGSRYYQVTQNREGTFDASDRKVGETALKDYLSDMKLVRTARTGSKESDAGWSWISEELDEGRRK